MRPRFPSALRPPTGVLFILPLLLACGRMEGRATLQDTQYRLVEHMPTVDALVQLGSRPDDLEQRAMRYALLSTTGSMIMELERDLRQERLDAARERRSAYFQRTQTISDGMIKEFGMYAQTKGKQRQAWDTYSAHYKRYTADLGAVSAVLLPAVADPALKEWMTDWFARTPNMDVYQERMNALGPQIVADAQPTIAFEWARPLWWVSLALLILLIYWVFRGVRKGFAPVGTVDGDPWRFTVRGKIYTVLHDTGPIARPPETLVTTTTTTNQQGQSWSSRSERLRFFVMMEDGTEKSFEFHEPDLRVAQGHLFSALAFLPKGKKFASYAHYYNHNTRQHVGNHNLVRGMMKPRKRVLLWLWLLPNVALAQYCLYLVLYHEPEVIYNKLTSVFTALSNMGEGVGGFYSRIDVQLGYALFWVLFLIVYFIIRGWIIRRRLRVLEKECIGPVLERISSRTMGYVSAAE